MSTRRHVTSKVVTLYLAEGIFEPECGHHFSAESAYGEVAWSMMLAQDRYMYSKHPKHPSVEHHMLVKERLMRFLAFVDKRRQQKGLGEG